MTYEFKLSQAEMQVIFAGLGELPLKVGLNLFGKLQGEIQRQDAEKAKSLKEIIPPPTDSN